MPVSRHRSVVQYLVVTSTRPLAAVRQSLGQHVRVLVAGSGTVEDSSAMWFEVTRRGPQEPFPALNDLRAALTPSECIRSLQTVAEGDGKDLARQESFLSNCVGGLWRDGVPGGVEVCPEPEEPEEVVVSEQQMPLFG